MIIPPVAVGAPASGFSDWERRVIHLHGFAGLTTTQGESVKSPEFTCCGHQWRLRCFPGGNRDSDDVMVGLFLVNMSAKSIELDCYGFSVKDSDGCDVEDCITGSYESRLFEPVDSSGRRLHLGYANFAEHSDLLRVLVAGTLVVEVRMKCADSRADPPPFVGENPSLSMLRRIFLDEKSADVVFEVGGGDRRRPDSNKRSRTDAVKIHAHRFILNHSAPMLAALCPPGDGVVSVVINDIEPEVFRPLLCHLYGGEGSKDDYKSHAREIIDAADLYEIVGLKLAVEAWYVQSAKIDLANVMELLLYSDAKNLALLKEAVMDFIVANRKDVLEKVPLNEAPSGLYADLLAATTRGMENNTGNMATDDFSSMRISDLRRKVQDKGLSIDGSREMLIAALKRSN